MFGIAPKPVKTRRGLEIGGGQVYAELNFTPIMSINDSTLPRFTNITRNCRGSPFVHTNWIQKVLYSNWKTLLEMTKTPQIGIEIVKIMNEICEKILSKTRACLWNPFDSKWSAWIWKTCKTADFAIFGSDDGTFWKRHDCWWRLTVDWK